ncbi:hypothetical protein [Candidatus Methylomicrobium oryzae]|uniref:hypothetical protein n=1 Tax=Candidatus Methylomicrobium oryzae TaxID=2802053 RepID=UPI001920959A|nr:hypothetical protein [Methylomicrobium sp. RS1]MBL1262866.1 hypothetical protein [Methylomicrobium sp. RS1]
MIVFFSFGLQALALRLQIFLPGRQRKLGRKRSIQKETRLSGSLPAAKGLNGRSVRQLSISGLYAIGKRDPSVGRAEPKSKILLLRAL